MCIFLKDCTIWCYGWFPFLSVARVFNISNWSFVLFCFFAEKVAGSIQAALHSALQYVNFTSQVMLAKLYHCMTVVPDCMPVSMSFKCLCRFYNSLQLLMCNCEDLVPAQELKGTSLPTSVVDNWEEEKQKAELVLKM